MPTTSPLLSQLSQAVTELATEAGPSVVAVGRAGSGFIFDDGLVVTNAHNLRDPVVITFDDGSEATATVAGADTDGDLAVLSVATGARHPLEWPSTGPVPGQAVVGLSRPRGRGLRVGLGWVSGLGLSFRGPEGHIVTGAFQHSAALPRGSSGGPVVGADGSVVGINTSREGESSYLAIPTDADLRARLGALAQGKVPRRRLLGVALAPPRAARRLRQAVGLPPRAGLLVHAVSPDGPAARAGVRQGDLIVAVAAQDVVSVEDLAAALAGLGEAATASLALVRGAEELTVTVDFATGGADMDEAS